MNFAVHWLTRRVADRPMSALPRTFMRPRFVIIAALLVILCAAVLPALATAQTATTPSLIVKVVAGLTTDQQAEIVARNGGTLTGSISALRLLVVAVPPDQVDATLSRYRADPQVQSAEVNKTRTSETVPNDPLYVNQWALPKIGWDQVFGVITPTGSAKVAVLDTGVDASHPELAGKVLAGTSILDGSNGMTDPSGHGTWLAGIIAAQTDTLPVEGIAAVGYAGVQIVPVTVLNANGEGQDSDVIAGVLWAADHGADVILMAFSAPDFSQNLQDAIDYAWSKGVVVVAAVGNNAVSTPTFPAGDRGVMGVAATDQNDGLALFSNAGQAVFIAAPGVDIQTIDLNGNYIVISGTSTSAAYVAGLAAFMKAVDPTLSNGIIVGRIARNADPAGTQDQTGNGRINMPRALADTSTEFIEPAGAAPVGNGGPFVGPYVAAAANSISPSSGPIAGGTLVTITGNNNFANGGAPYTVLFDTTSVPAVRVDNDHITAITPAHAAGVVSVTPKDKNNNNAGTPTTFTYFGSAAKLAFTTQPSNATAGTALGTQPSVTIQDAAGNTVTNASNSITLTIGTNPGGGTLSVTTNPLTATNGAAQFSGVSIDKTGNGYTLIASASGLTAATSNAFNITAGNATKLAFLTAPFTVAVNQCSPPMTVQSQDASGNPSTPGGPQPRTINLTSNSANGRFFSDSSCTTQITSTTIPSGTSPNFFYRDGTAGTPVVTATIVGNPTLTSATQTETVNKRTTTTTVAFSTNPIDVSQSTTATVTVSDTDAGTRSSPGVGASVTVISDSSDTIGGTCTLAAATASTSTCSVTVTPTTVSGSHNISATFSTTAIHQGSGGTSSLTVNPRSTSTSVVLVPSTVDVNQPSTATVTVTDTDANGTKVTPTGTVGITVGVGGDVVSGVCILGQTVPGTATCTVTVTPQVQPGAHTVTATFAATNVHSTSTDTKTLTVNARSTSTSVSLLPSTVDVNQPTTVTVTVNDSDPNGTKVTPTGTVGITVGVGSDVVSGVCTLGQTVLGTATCAVTVTPQVQPGTHTVTATFAATNVHSTSTDTKTLTVNARSTSTSVSLLPSTVDVNQPTTVTVTVSDADANGTKVTPTGTLGISVGVGTDAVSGTCTLAQTVLGTATCAVTVTPAQASGTHTITATFSATAIHSESADTKTLTVNTRSTATSVNLVPGSVVTGQPTTVNVTVSDTYSNGTKATPTGTVGISVGVGTDLVAGTCNLTQTVVGTAACSVTITPAHASGTHTITATFTATDIHSGSSNTQTLTVNRADTTTVITSDLSAATKVGDPYTVQWSVTVNPPGAGTLTGNVTVSDGTDSCAAAVGAGGCSLTSTTPGLPKTITATYGGDTDFNTSAGTTTHKVDTPPAGIGDWYVVVMNKDLVVYGPGVLGNDTDPDAQTLSVATTSLISVPTATAHGTIDYLNSDGSFRYRPQTGFTGIDTFTYKTTDGLFDSPSPVTVTITVIDPAATPVAENDAYHATKNLDLIVTGPGILANDQHTVNHALAAVLENGPMHGTLTLDPSGSFTYSPTAGYAGADSFTYHVHDATTNTDSNTAMVVILVREAGATPTAENDSYTTDEGTLFTVALASGVLFNDSGSGLSAGLVVGTTFGTLAFDGNGGFTYTPDAGFFGRDSFIYRMHNADGYSNQAEVTIIVSPVNSRPTANAQTVQTDEDTALSITLSGSDAETSAANLTFTVTAQPTHGTLSGSAPNLTYTPASNYNGPDSVKFTVTDRGKPDSCGTPSVDCADAKTSLEATVSITVRPVNDPPVANAQTVTTNEDTSVVITLTGSDTETPANQLMFAVATPPAHGSLTGVAPNVTYTPNANYNGPDSFTFTVTDRGDPDNCGTPSATCAAAKTSVAAIVSITVNPVNDPPTASSQNVSTNEDTPKGVTLNGGDIDSTNLSFTVASGPSHGTLSATSGVMSCTPVANGTGTPGATCSAYVTYTPAPNYNGPDSFTFTVSDGALASNTATVSITVYPVDDAPTTAGQSVTTDEDTPKSITLSASDIDSTAVSFTVTGGPSHGLLSATSGAMTCVAVSNDTGTPGANCSVTITYTPAANYNGPDSFTYTVGDGSLSSSPATVSITVNPVNDPPVADAKSATTAEDITKTITLSGNDIDSTSLTFTVVVPPSHGQLSATTGTMTCTPVPNGTGTAGSTCTADISYTPGAEYNGPDTFQYRVADGGGLMSPAVEVSITVTEVNDPPVAVNDMKTTQEDTPLSFPAADLLVNDSTGPANESTQTLTVTAVGAASNGTVGLTAGTITYTPSANYNGPDSFTYTVCDNGTTNGVLDSKCATATVNIMVTAVNDNPIAGNDYVTGVEDTPLTIQLGIVGVSGLLKNDQPGPGNESGQALTITGVTSPSTQGGTVILVSGASDGSGTITYAPAANFNGSDSFQYTVCDNGTTNNVADSKCATATVYVKVTEVNDPPTANDDPVTTSEDTSLPIAASSLLVNDSRGPANESGQTLEVIAVGLANHGTVTLSADRLTITYTPSPNYNGPDAFTYTIRDNGTTNGAPDPKTSTATVYVTVTSVNDPPAIGATPPTQSVQYSDPIVPVIVAVSDVDSLSAAIVVTTQWKKDSGAFTAGLPAGLTISGSAVDVNNGTTTPGSSGTWTISGNAMVAAGTYVIRTTVSDGTAYKFSDVTIYVTPENARPTYIGMLYVSTQSTATGGFTATLSSTVQDVTAYNPVGDPNPGDIRNATVTFFDRTANTPLCTANIGLVTTGDTKTGTATCNWTGDIGSSDSIQYTIGIAVKGTTAGDYYMDNETTYDTVLTVSKPLTNFITGGGYLLMGSTSAGQYKGDEGSKTNYGFNVKYNKSGTNLQGNANIIVRSGGRVYQIKSNSITSLSAQTTSVGGTAQFASKANITDVTDPANPIAITGSATLQLTMTDNGEPGTNDSLAITVLNKDGGLFYASKWNGVKTVEQTIGGGNLVVH